MHTYKTDCCKLADRRGFERGRKERQRTQPIVPIVPKSPIEVADIVEQLKRIADVLEAWATAQHIGERPSMQNDYVLHFGKP
jgi:hypothetical protein